MVYKWSKFEFFPGLGTQCKAFIGTYPKRLFFLRINYSSSIMSNPILGAYPKRRRKILRIALKVLGLLIKHFIQLTRKIKLNDICLL